MKEINTISVDGQDYDLAIKLGNGLTYNDNHELEFYTDDTLGIKDGLLGVNVSSCGGIKSTSYGLEVDTGEGLTLHKGKISLKIGSGIEVRGGEEVSVLLAPDSGLNMEGSKGLHVNLGRGLVINNHNIELLLASNSGLKMNGEGLLINFGRGMTYDQYGGLTLNLGSGLKFEEGKIRLDEEYWSEIGLGSGSDGNLRIESCSATPLNIYNEKTGSVFRTNTRI